MKTNISCARYSGIARAENSEKKYVAQLRCKQWDCAYCARQNALQWRAAIIDYINKSSHTQWSFWTVTVPARVHNHEDIEARYSIGLALIQASWDKLMKRAKRYLGKFEYVRVIETHTSGAPHIHLLASVFMSDSVLKHRHDGSQYHHSAWLKENATACGFGYIHDCQNIVNTSERTDVQNAGYVASYVAKYMTKDDSKDDSFRKKMRVRKIQTSRGIKRLNLSSDLSWEVSGRVSVLEIVQTEKPIFDVTTGNTITIEHLRGQEAYPPIEDEQWIKNRRA